MVPRVPGVRKLAKGLVPMVLVLGALVSAVPTASAQTPAPADQTSPAKLIVEKIENSWLLAPDVRVERCQRQRRVSCRRRLVIRLAY